MHLNLNLKLKQLFTVYFPVLLIDFAFSSVLTNAAFYTSRLGLSSTFLGMLMAVTTGFFAAFAIPFGRLSDSIERSHVLYAACLVLGVASIGLPRCRSSVHLLMVFPALGISMALFWPAYEAWLAEREGEGHLVERVMLFNLFWSSGVTLGPAISGYLYSDTNPFIPFYLAGISVLFTLVAIFSGNFGASGIAKTAVSESPETLYPSSSVRSVYLNLARCANFASWFVLGVLRRLAPKLTKEAGMLPTTFGNLMLMLGGVQTLAFVVLGTGYSTRWHYRFAPFLVVQLLAIVSFLGIWHVQHTLLWSFAFGSIGVSVAFTYFSSLYYGLDRHSDKGNKSGWHEAILGVGILLGPLFGGILADSRFGVQSPYLLCAVGVAFAILVEVFILLRGHQSSGGSL